LKPEIPMAPNDASIESDALILLRDTITKSQNPVPISDPSATDPTPLETATHLYFNTQKVGDDSGHQIIELSTPTRFISQQTNAPLDLLSVYFCWINKDAGLQEYINALQTLNAQRIEKSLGGVTNVVFTERVDLASWLNGENDESEFIKSLDNTSSTRKAANEAAQIASGGLDVHMGDVDGRIGFGTITKADEERVKAICKLERIMGDRNTVLRGIKPTVSVLIFITNVWTSLMVS